MFLKHIQSEGDWIATYTITAWNRTGSTIHYSEAAMLDIIGTQTETTSVAPGDPNSCFNNMTPVTQTPFEDGFPVLICLDPTIADNAKGRWLVCGVTDVAVFDDDVSSITAVNRGEALSMVVAHGTAVTSGSAARAFEKFVTGGTGSRRVGLLLEDAAADSTTTARTVGTNGATTNPDAHYRPAIYYGGIPGYGATDT